MILDRIAHGDITPKPNIAELGGDRVRFVDGTSEPIDAIIYCTGYKVSFPFFDEDFLAAPDNDLPLFLRMFKPGIDNLFFIGLLQPLGAIFPAAERQACLAGEYLCGRYALPSADAKCKRDRGRARRHVSSLCEIEATYDAGRFRRLHAAVDGNCAGRTSSRQGEQSFLGATARANDHLERSIARQSTLSELFASRSEISLLQQFDQASVGFIGGLPLHGARGMGAGCAGGERVRDAQSRRRNQCLRY